jgi:hypothetical protein
MCQRSQCYQIHDLLAAYESPTLARLLKLLQNRQSYWRRAIRVELAKRGEGVCDVGT